MAVKEIKLEFLNSEGETVVYKENFIPARKVREALEIFTLMEKGELSELEVLDKMLSYVVGLFKNEKVTEDAILDGMASWDLMETLQNVMADVMGTNDPKMVPPVK